MERVWAEPVDIKNLAPNPGLTTFADVVNIIVHNAFMLAGVICFLLLVFGGLGVIMGAGGDPKKLESSKKAITGAVIGLILVVTSYWVVQLLETITGVTLLSKPVR